MGRKRSMQASLILMWAALLFHFVLSEMNFEDQKNFFFPDPNATPLPPPTVSYTPPAGGHSTPPPSHGGGSHGSTPPAHCSSPPSGGDNHHPSPPTRGAGGGYRHSPPTSTPTPSITIPPPRIHDPTIRTPPTPPSSFDPSSPPFTCTYWKNHPTLVWGMLGWWGSVGSAFGVSSTPGGVGAKASLLQALSNSRRDGYGELYREGTAALLNSMAQSKFPYTTTHVRESFVAALSSDKAASAQAQLFQLANEGRIKPRD